MAKRLFDVPTALISIVDENRQWFKSCIDLDAKETSRDISSFCGHAILGNELFIIEDATKDPRFSDNPLVLDEPKIRFYAGCPLRAPDGHMMGTLCVIDYQPRQLNQDDLVAFKDLAAMAEHEFAAIHLATFDELTNISNRRGFMALAQHDLDLCERQHMPASLIYFDLNKFKKLNDENGHIAGDQALITFVKYIKSTLRSSDLFARIGGDEFAVLLVNTTKEHAEDMVARSQHGLKIYNQNADHEYDILFSYGIVEFDPDQHSSVEALLADGDVLMYQHKRATA